MLVKAEADKHASPTLKLPSEPTSERLIKRYKTDSGLSTGT